MRTRSSPSPARSRSRSRGFFTPSSAELESVVCGKPADVTRVVGRGELLDAALPHGLALRDHVQTLRHVANMLEMGDEDARRASTSDEPAGKVGIPQVAPDEEGDEDA